MADILKSRKWTDGCIHLGATTYHKLLVLGAVPLSTLHVFGVGVEISTAFMNEIKKRGVDMIYLIPDERLDRVECLLDLVLSHRGQKREGNLWSRKTLMEVMHKDKPTGGYALVKRTFDRLVKIGFDLDVKDFILLDEEEEEALEPFRKGSGG